MTGDPQKRYCCLYLGHFLISWDSNKQNVVSKSSTKLEFTALALTVYEVDWIRSTLKDAC